MVNKSFSKPIEVKSGVPQGSVLGRLIFLILIGDIDKDVNEAFLSSFADDTRIGRQIGSPNDSELLQKDLCAVYNWTHDNNMELNASKFECLRYGTNSDLQQFPYKSNTGCTIEERDHLKDLGVTMSRDGTFKKHIQTTKYCNNSSEPMLLDPQDLYDKGSVAHAYPVEITCPV